MSHSDPELSQVLQSWRPELPPAPQFRAAVWARIDRAREAPWAAAALLARGLGIPVRHFRWALPLGAALALVLAALAGVGVGALQGSLQENDRMAAAYVRTVDPLQMTAGHHP